MQGNKHDCEEHNKYLYYGWSIVEVPELYRQPDSQEGLKKHKVQSQRQQLT